MLSNNLLHYIAEPHAFKTIELGIVDLVKADFAAGAVLISFGAVLGKTTPLQMLLVVFFEKWADRTQQSAVEKQKKIQDIIAKWRLMPAMLALRAWVDVVVMMKKARKFARRILMLACARSLNAWLLLVENNKRVRAFLRRMVLRMQNRRVARLYDGWLLYTDMMLERKELKIQKVLHRINTRWERQFFINRK